MIETMKPPAFKIMERVEYNSVTKLVAESFQSTGNKKKSLRAHVGIPILTDLFSSSYNCDLKVLKQRMIIGHNSTKFALLQAASKLPTTLW